MKEKAVDESGHPHFGRCPCSGTYDQKWVEVKMHAENVVVDEVPQGACPTCGSRVYKSAVLRELETLLSGSADRSS